MAHRQSMIGLGLDGGITDIATLDGKTPPPFSFENNLGIGSPKTLLQISPAVSDSTYWGPTP